MQVNRGPAALTRLLDALGEPTRRRIYEAVRTSRRPLSRVDTAALVGISVRLAAFHLDRLVEGGLLVVHYARPPGRRGGPGAGRPTKWYTATAEGLEVTLPPRRNDIAARILVRATSAAGPEAAVAVRAAASQIGAELAQDCVGDSDLEALLVDLGYEPSATADGALDLVNCPFHELVDQDLEAVCSMNLALLDAAASQARSTRVASLEPRDGRCCVRLQPMTPSGPAR